MRDHGGNLDAAMARFGGTGWVDLSTGINRAPYPVPDLPIRAWTDLPTRSDMARLSAAARTAYGAGGAVVPLSGAQQAIQLLPRLIAPRSAPALARVLSPTYNEHAVSLTAAGWRVEQVPTLAALAGADLAVLVNPNNPDGRSYAPADLLALRRKVGTLIVDESFADPVPELSLAPQTGEPGLWVLRSFGKFYGLAGLRLGFALGAEAEATALADLAGPWPVCGAAVEIGCTALADRPWAATTRARLAEDARRLDALSPWPLLGGGSLFRLYDTPDAEAAQAHLARNRVWSRIFPWSPRLIRLGLPAAAEWGQVEAAFSAL